MNYPSVNLLDLPDEIFLIILKNLSYVDVLYSLIAVDQKFDRLTRDIMLTQSLDLTSKYTSNDDDHSKIKSIRDQICLHILPQIQHNIQSLTLDPWSMDRVLLIGHYPQLHKLTLVDLHPGIAYIMFRDESSFIYSFKHQISHLVVITHEDRDNRIYCRFYACIFVNICIQFTNLIHFHLDMDEKCFCPTISHDLSSITGHSFKMVYLNIKVNKFDDCLFLLNDHLSQLRTFIISVRIIHETSTTIQNTRILANLKCFSLTSHSITFGYDNLIVPCLRQMSQLRKLTLSLRVRQRTSFIDGTHLNNDIISKMPYLHTFIFDIVTECDSFDRKYLQSSDDIRRPLIEKGYDVACYMDRLSDGNRRCHIYSLPFTMKYINTITSKFCFDSVFTYVRQLCVNDRRSSIEYDFFILISQGFPLLEDLTVISGENQKKRSEHEQTSSIIEYSHLMKLNLGRSHVDYAKQFLLDRNIRVPCLRTLIIDYEYLLNVTENFTNNTIHAKCETLKKIIFPRHFQRIIINEKVFTCFPLVEIKNETKNSF